MSETLDTLCEGRRPYHMDGKRVIICDKPGDCEHRRYQGKEPICTKR